MITYKWYLNRKLGIYYYPISEIIDSKFKAIVITQTGNYKDLQILNTSVLENSIKLENYIQITNFLKKEAVKRGYFQYKVYNKAQVQSIRKLEDIQFPFNPLAGHLYKSNYNCIEYPDEVQFALMFNNPTDFKKIILFSKGKWRDTETSITEILTILKQI